MTGGASPRRRGDSIEREITERHKALGIHSERYPLSGASRFRGSGHDIDVYLFRREQAPLVAEVKARKGGSGFVQLENWLGTFDLLFLRRNHADPMVVVPWRVWARLLQGGVDLVSEQGDVTEIGIARERKSHVFVRHPNDRYVEPAWCSERLFAVERFAGQIWDPACGLGTILKAATGARYPSFGSDIAQDATGTVQDFLTATAPVREFSIVTNPPFGLIRKFAEALELGAFKVAMICPTARLNAAHWLGLLPLARVYLLTPRPSMPPVEVILRGDKPGGGRADFCWLIFEPGHEGAATIEWLHRTGSWERPRQRTLEELLK